MQPAYVDAYHVLTTHVLRVALRRYVSSIHGLHFVNLGSIDYARLGSAQAWLCGRLKQLGSARRAAKAKGTTARTIERWVQRFEQTGSVADAPRAGRPRSSMHLPKTKPILKRCVRKKMSSERIRDVVAKKLGITTSVATVRRALRDHKCKAKRPVRKPIHTDRHKKDRLRFCKHWKRHSWARVMLSDSKIFLLYPAHRYPKWHHGFWASCPNMAQILPNI